MRKNAITKPKFGKIFAIRFLIALAAFGIIGAYSLYRLDDYVWQKNDAQFGEYLKSMTELAQKMSWETHDPERYDRDLGLLKMYMANFQTFNHTYVEVTVKNDTITVGDTAYFSIVNRPDENSGNKEVTEDYYFIKDISLLNPVNEYMDGMLDERKQVELYNKIGRDPLFENTQNIGKLDNYRVHKFMNAYINREDHTFLPGIVKVDYLGEEYTIDCTPADTSGYEKIEFNARNGFYGGMYFWICYRENPNLTSANFLWHLVPDHDLVVNSIYNEDYPRYVSEGLVSANPSWHIGYSQPYYATEPAFELAPVSSAVIIISTILVAAVVALILANIRYQKDKAVWKIFEYRVKTAEAMAHDLKTPLSTIMFYLENMEDSAQDPNEVLKYTRNISDKVSKMDHMIGDMLQLSQSESGKIKLVKESLSLRELISESLKEFPDMEADVCGENITLVTDKKVLSQVVMNLLSNCHRYKVPGSVVRVVIDKDSFAFINKTDRTYDDVDSLRKPFVKGDDSRGSKGAGLGLAIADNNLALLGYKMEIKVMGGEFCVRVKF